jgi:hypothetical protein
MHLFCGPTRQPARAASAMPHRHTLDKISGNPGGCSAASAAKAECTLPIRERRGFYPRCAKSSKAIDSLILQHEGVAPPAPQKFNTINTFNIFDTLEMARAWDDHLTP